MFRSEKHSDLFTKMRVSMSEKNRNNKAHLAFIFIITGNEELYAKTKSFYDVETGNLDESIFMELLHPLVYSTELPTLANLAANLLNNNRNVSPVDLVEKLSQDNFELALAAIRLRKQGMSTSYESNNTNSYL